MVFKIVNSFSFDDFDDYSNSKRKAKNNINRKPHRKVSKLKSKFLLILGILSRGDWL